VGEKRGDKKNGGEGAGQFEHAPKRGVPLLEKKKGGKKKECNSSKKWGRPEEKTAKKWLGGEKRTKKTKKLPTEARQKKPKTRKKPHESECSDKKKTRGKKGEKKPGNELMVRPGTKAA